MQISLYWLNDLLNLRSYPLSFFVEKLILNGIEIENGFEVQYENKRSFTLEIYATANRGDVLCIRGIAKEFKALIYRYKRRRLPPRVKEVEVSKLVKLNQDQKCLKMDVGFEFPPEVGGGIHGLKKLRYNNVKKFPGPRKESKLTIKQLTLRKFQWHVEDIAIGGYIWKHNRTTARWNHYGVNYFNDAVFNTNDPGLYSKFICLTAENTPDLTSPKWLQKRLVYSGIMPKNSLIDFQNYFLLESGCPFEFYDLEKINLNSNSDKNKFKMKLCSGNNSKITATDNINYKLNNDVLVVKADDNILSIAGTISNKEFSWTSETKSLLIEGSVFNSRMMRRQSRLLNLKTIRSAAYGRGGIDGDFVLNTLYRLLLLLKVRNPKTNYNYHTASYSALSESQIYHVHFVCSYDWEAVKVVRHYDFWLREKRIRAIIGEGAYQYNPITKKQNNRITKITSTHIYDCLNKLRLTAVRRARPGHIDHMNIIYGRVPQVPFKLNHIKKRWRRPMLACPEGRFWLVKVPSRRREDITREIDIIEEICRVYGVNRIESLLYKANEVGKGDLSYNARKIITRHFLDAGFYELLSYSLINDKFNKNQVIKLINPLSREYSTLRRSLLPNLIQIANENIKQGNSIIRGFEYGHVFLRDSNGKFVEAEYVSGIFGGIKIRSNWSDQLRDLSWFEAKGKIESLLEKLNITTVWKKETENINVDIFHPYRTAGIYLADNTNTLLGVFGQLNPFLARKLNMNPNFYLFEFSLKLLSIELKEYKTITYKPYSVYPKIIKDLSFVVDKNIPFNLIKQTIYSEGSHLLTEVNLLDNYEGNKIPANQTSLCVQLIFQSQISTLRNVDINPIIEQISLVLINKYNITLR